MFKYKAIMDGDEVEINLDTSRLEMYYLAKEDDDWVFFYKASGYTTHTLAEDVDTFKTRLENHLARQIKPVASRGGVL